MKLNQQEPEKQVREATGLYVNSIFHTIQGEGPFNGEPAVFVRLAGCNLQCPLCDTEYTQRSHLQPALVVSEVIKAIMESTCAGDTGRDPSWYQAFCDLVVITGGEPFRQPIGRLIQLLIAEGFRVQVETNGTLYQPAVNYAHPNLTIVCSPKTGQVNKNLLPWIKAFKYVASAASLKGSEDGLPQFALDHPAAPRLFRPPPGNVADVYLQPVDEQEPHHNRWNQEAVVASCLKHGYRLCLQMHKIVGVA